MRKSEVLVRATIGTGLIQINATVLELFDIAKWCISAIEEEGLEGFDLDALRKAGASLLDCVEQVLVAVEEQGAQPPQKQEAEELIANLRKSLA